MPLSDTERAAVVAETEAAIVAWLREYGNHPPAPNCERCNAADAIERGEYRGVK